MNAPAITLFTKTGGALTKSIRLVNGSVISDGSACVMTEGQAQRLSMPGAAELADLMMILAQNQAVAFGPLRADLPEIVPIRAQVKINGASVDGAIARTKINIVYEPGRPAWALIDFDRKAMPTEVADRIRDLGGLWSALVSVLPPLAEVERVERASTSAGLYRTDTGEQIPGSGGVHIAILVKDGSDIERFLKAAHARCWLAGLGWYMVGAAGQLLDRSAVDRCVGSPERLIFEAAPILDPPLAQDAETRRPKVYDGEPADTITACPPLSASEETRLRELHAREATRLDTDASKARAAFVTKQAKRIVERTGMAPDAAERIVERQCDGVLLPDIELPFDDPALAGTTVAQVLADPDRFVGETLADPLEGIEYGRCKAKIMRHPHGALWINSFAHGRTVYEMKPSTTPLISVTAGERHKAADAGIVALLAAGTAFYQRDRSLVRVCQVQARSSAGDIILVPGIAAVTPAILDRALGQAAQWQRFDIKTNGWVRADPPRPVVAQILDMSGEWPFPPLAGLIGCPTLRPDGSQLATEGYDFATGLVLISAVTMPQLSDCPSRRDAEDAVALLASLLDEFPFANKTGKAVAMSMLLTSVLRGAMPVVPLHLVTAPEPGSGKSYLADIASMIATGERAAVVAVAPNPEETEKRLIGAALSGHPIIALDNCRETLEGDFLCQISERPLLQLRALGKSDKIRVTNTFTVFANGNNVAVADDMVRRTICCALDANVENPECRIFRGDPLAAVRQNRGAYIGACLTIARAYFAAGKPGRLPPLASYGAWSDTVRSPLVWLGLADPVDSMAAARRADPVRQERARVFEAWRDDLGIADAYTAPEIIERVEARHSDDGSFMRPSIAAALTEIAQKRGGSAGQLEPRRLGKWLTKQENTIANGLKLTADRADERRVRYRVREARP